MAVCVCQVQFVLHTAPGQAYKYEQSLRRRMQTLRLHYATFDEGDSQRTELLRITPAQILLVRDQLQEEAVKFGRNVEEERAMGSFIDSFDVDDGLEAFKLGLSTFADGLLGLACKNRSIRVHHEEFQDVGMRAAYMTALWDFLRLPHTQPAVLTTDAIEFANALGRAASLQLELNTVKCARGLLKEDLAKSQSELERLNAAKDESVQIKEKLVRYKRELNLSKGAHYRTERALERTQGEPDRVKEELALIKDVLVQTQADVLRTKCEFEWFKSVIAELEQTRERLRHELEDRVLELERALAHERISPTINQDSNLL